MKVELHLLQNVAPSCLNRDDTNTPKDCEFGGHRRARISSQAFKRAIRLSPVFRETLLPEKPNGTSEEVPLGTRTKKLVSRLTADLTKEKRERKQEEAQAIAIGFAKEVMSAVDENKENKTKVLLYLGEDEIKKMGDIASKNYDKLLCAKKKQDAKAELENQSEKKKSKKEQYPFRDACKEVAKEFKSKTKAADIAMFGRMMAEHPGANIDAACQVAHAISTNKVSMEMDYYTAVDDLLPKEETGAGMMGFIGFNSSCLYRYAAIDLDQLEKNLDGDTDLAHKAVKAFLCASVTALPTGKQNSMAAHNPPDAVFAVVRHNGTSVSLANAFCRPVRPGYDSDLMTASIKEMDTYWSKLTKVYGADGVAAKAICTIPDVELEGLADVQKDSFRAVVEVVMGALKGPSNGEGA